MPNPRNSSGRNNNNNGGRRYNAQRQQQNQQQAAANCEELKEISTPPTPPRQPAPAAEVELAAIATPVLETVAEEIAQSPIAVASSPVVVSASVLAEADVAEATPRSPSQPNTPSCSEVSTPVNTHAVLFQQSPEFRTVELPRTLTGEASPKTERVAVPREAEAQPASPPTQSTPAVLPTPCESTQKSESGAPLPPPVAEPACTGAETRSVDLASTAEQQHSHYERIEGLLVYLFAIVITVASMLWNRFSFARRFAARTFKLLREENIIEIVELALERSRAGQILTQIDAQRINGKGTRCFQRVRDLALQAYASVNPRWASP